MTLKITYASNKQFADQTAGEFQSQLENLGFKKKQVEDMVAGFRDGMIAQLRRMKDLGAVEYVETVEPEVKNHPIREFSLALTRTELEELIDILELGESELTRSRRERVPCGLHAAERARALIEK